MRLITVFIFCVSFLATAQEGFSSKGKFMIHNNFNGQGIFVYNNYLIDGVVQTQNTTNPNKIIFAENASWTLKNENSFVDGYVKTKVKTNFVFPVGGGGLYKPLALDNSENAVVAYQRIEPMNRNWMDSVTIQKISPIEFWNVSSVTNSNITLTYDGDISGLKDNTKKVLNRLTIVGWDGYKWIRIPSRIDSFLIDKNNPIRTYTAQNCNETQGSITSTVMVPLIYFSAFTLALTNHDYKSQEYITQAQQKQTPQKQGKDKNSVTKGEKIPKTEDSAIAKIEETSPTENVASYPEKIILSENRNKDYKLMRKIHFSFNENELSQYSTNLLSRVVRELQDLNGDYRLKLVGHTDTFGSNDYNYTLGLRRAETIKQFLLKNGITNVGVEVVSVGESEADTNCVDCKASEMLANRRVDIFVIQQKK